MRIIKLDPLTVRFSIDSHTVRHVMQDIVVHAQAIGVNGETTAFDIDGVTAAELGAAPGTPISDAATEKALLNLVQSVTVRAEIPQLAVGFAAPAKA